MTIFYENGLSHIGIVDMYNDIVYYYHSNNTDKTLVSISGQVFENNTICRDNDIHWMILEYFAENGKKFN